MKTVEFFLLRTFSRWNFFWCVDFCTQFSSIEYTADSMVIIVSLARKSTEVFIFDDSNRKSAWI